MRKIAILMGVSMLMAGCSGTPTATAPAVQEKAVNTTLTGTITKSGGKFFISGAGQATKEIDSYTVKLDDYVGKKVSITGQYSGTTLFVDTIVLQ